MYLILQALFRLLVEAGALRHVGCPLKVPADTGQCGILQFVEAAIHEYLCYVAVNDRCPDIRNSVTG